MTKDLFGNAPKKSVYKGGYAGMVGAGPKGERCKTCTHYYINLGFKKCRLVKATRGAGTDILANAPACDRWENNNV